MSKVSHPFKSIDELKKEVEEVWGHIYWQPHSNYWQLPQQPDRTSHYSYTIEDNQRVAKIVIKDRDNIFEYYHLKNGRKVSLRDSKPCEPNQVNEL